MTRRQFLTYSITVLIMLIGVQQSIAVHYIPSDTSIGTWDSVSRTYTLTSDVSDSIEIEEDNLILDGDGYSVIGRGPFGPYPPSKVSGVYLSGRTGITLKNLTVHGFNYGIYLDSSSNNTLTGNITSQNSTGITLRNSSNNTLTDNIASMGIRLESGFFLLHSSNNTLTGNIASQNPWLGISLHQSSYNTLTGNVIWQNGRGIGLGSSTNNTLTGNEISGSIMCNFSVGGASYEDFDHTIDTTNTVEGKPLYYVKNVNNQVFDSSTNAGVFYAINCDNIIIKDLTLAKNNLEGIFLWNTHNSRIENVVVSECLSGILLRSSSNNTITDNIASQNGGGIQLSESSNTTLTNNTLIDNYYGIYLGTDGSQVYNNNFIDNGIQVYCEGDSGNLFNLDKPIGGNYWSDWTGPDDDEDGFVDSPYVFEGGQDNLPWTVKNGWFTPQVRIEQLIAEVESLNLQQGISNSLDSKLDAVEKALDDVNENNDGAAVNALEAFINAVNAQRGGKISEEDANVLIEMAEQIIELLTNG